MTRFIALLLLAFTACKHGGGGISGADAASAFHPSARPKTNSSAITINNLDGEIDDAEKRMARGESVARQRLPGKLIERASALGTLDDYDRADEVSAKNVEAEPDSGEVRMARTHVLSSLHRFDEALTELKVAESHGAEFEDVLRTRASILLATGQCAEASRIYPALPYATDLAARGAMEQRLGHPELAETLFERSRTEFRDISPIRFAWMDFERARAFEREGDTMRARVYLEDALEAFPEYAHAAVHAALLESPDRALAILAPVEKRSNDPDVFAAHGDALRRSQRDAAPFVARAHARVDELLAKHPEAFADHAARFFIGAGGDLKRALDLAKGAAAKAPSEETLELWLTAARALSNQDEACAAVAAADKTSCPLRASRAQFDAARTKCAHWPFLQTTAFTKEDEFSIVSPRLNCAGGNLMNYWKPVALVAIVGLVSSVGMQIAQAQVCHGQRNMQNALDSFRAGRASLNAAEHNKGGWRDRAIIASDNAIRETQAGCAYADTH